ncbi:MAG: sigma-70 family RNA polymerase sigma factor [Flavobacteriales bacterium]|nr:sigma-70 family RNA polymerase sigma factor [Flavobacteriales bacterium]
MNDHEIVQLIKRNDTGRAMNELYQYLPKVEGLILSKGGNKADAADVYQEALIIFCRKAKDEAFELTSAIGTYLYSTCRFLWKDQLKKRNKSSSEIKSDALVNGAESLSTQDEAQLLEAIVEEQKLLLAEKALSKLGDRCMDLLKLFYFEGMRMVEIAAKMGFSSEKIAKNQKYKCLERARRHLKELKQEAGI